MRSLLSTREQGAAPHDHRFRPPETTAQKLREERDRTPPRTNTEGQFTNGNQNPFPVPADYRGGTQGKIDVIHPENNKK